MLPHIETVMRGPEAWSKSETIRRSIEIQDGVIQNSKILRFQNRNEEYPYNQVSIYCKTKDSLSFSNNSVWYIRIFAQSDSISVPSSPE